MLDSLLEILRCPACVAGNPGADENTGLLYRDGDFLVCRTCGARYPLIDGIPDMTLAGETDAES
ncbi:MAG: Trm112 family protein [Planctomycetes bacterium]|nr:Trm112 family protein [Planctomycetota bacterium]